MKLSNACSIYGASVGRRDAIKEPAGQPFTGMVQSLKIICL